MTAVPVKATLIRGLSDIADRFDHVLLDQWGVLHHGDAVPAGVREAVAALRRAGKRVLVLSNSGKRAAANAARLAGLGLAPEAYDGLLSSGEACWRLLQRRDRPPFDRIGRHCLLVTRGDDRSIVEGLDLSLAKDIRDADFILMAGLDDALADPEIWRPRWAEAVTRDLPMICANPDLTMITAAGLAAGPGRIADLYEALGGDVTYVGKPHAPIYEECLALLGQPDPRRVLADRGFPRPRYPGRRPHGHGDGAGHLRHSRFGLRSGGRRAGDARCRRTARSRGGRQSGFSADLAHMVGTARR